MLDVEAVPESERSAATLALAHLSNLHNYVRDFEWALSLFELCTEFKGVIKTDWSFVAARDGAMTVYHFAKTFEILNTYVAKSPSLKAGSDKVAIKRAGRTLREFFPQINVLRDTIAHDGELKNTVEKAAWHPLKGPIRVGTLLVGNEAAQIEIKAIAGDQLVLTKAGALVGYRLNRAALEVLKQVAKEVSSAVRVRAPIHAASESDRD
ncbi:MAG: hypothetical protein H5U11_17730 [Rhizobium sp.]|nr:hypothetical protein [Rhizobium sp.]